MDRGGSSAVNAIVAIAALLVIASITYPYAEEWWETRGSGGGGSPHTNLTPTIEEIVTHPDLYHSGDNLEQVRQAPFFEIVGVFVKQGEYGGYLVDPHVYDWVYSTPKLRVERMEPHFPLGEYEEYRVRGYLVKLDPENPYYSPYENMKLMVSDEPFAIYPTSLQNPTPIKELTQNPSKYEDRIIVVVGNYTGVFEGLAGILSDEEGYTIRFYTVSILRGELQRGWRYLAKGMWTWSPVYQSYVLKIDDIGFTKLYPKTDVILVG